MRVKYLSVKHPLAHLLPNFSTTGSAKGMKKLYYGQKALLVRSGSYIYNVTSNPGIYYVADH